MRGVARVTAEDIPVGTPAADTVPMWHRGMALLAVVSMLIGTRQVWTDAVTVSPVLTLVHSATYGAILVLAVLALVVPSLRAMVLVDAAILVLGVVHVIAGYAVHPLPGDEGALTAQAAKAILGGEHIYGVPWPEVFHQPGVGLTKTMDGGADLTYAYPPLAPVLTAAAMRVVPILHAYPNLAATAVTTGALIAGAIALWLLLPVGWRSAGTAITLGYPLLPTYAWLGYPAVITVALLIPVVVRWPATGAGGNLRRFGVARAILLGAACAAHQLGWFIAPFLLVGLFAVRRGELSARSALLVVARFAAIAALTFLALNAVFAVHDGTAWLGGIFTPMLQHAVPHGQGLIGISYYLTGASGALDFYSYATLLFALAALVASILFMRSLGPALTVIPWLTFYLSVRSQDGYYLLMTPLWLAAVATVPRTAFAEAWQPRPGVLQGQRTRLATGGLVFAPALLCLGIAVSTAAPFRMQIVSADAHGAGVRGLWRLTVVVENVSGRPLVPHFAVSTNQSMSAYWRQQAGPKTLAPQQRATYTLVAANPKGYNPGSRDFFKLRAVTDHPQTLSSVTIPVPPPPGGDAG
ncbi:MAG: hypothetical protein ACJ77B_11590 [Chloroflexota bacterium]